MAHKKGETLLATYVYTLDNMGKRTQLTEQTFGTNAKTTVSNWEYDALGRLTKETVDANGTVSTTTHEYDAVSNRVKQIKDGVVTNYTYDANDRLTEETGARTASYTYDKQGNTLAQTVNGVTTNYSYNAKNELIQANDVSFNYDIDGVRSSKTKAGTTIDYTTDKNRDYAQVVLEKQNNQTVAAYTYGDDLISQNVAGGTSYFGYDGLGSTKFLTNTAGNITDTYQYDAYGEITNKTGTTDNNYLYTGEQYDRSLNQYYLRARYYNQGVGRFTQMDTWQGKDCTPVTLNKYVYGNAAPTFYTDPSGKFGLASFSVAQTIQGILQNNRSVTSAVAGRRLVFKAGCFVLQEAVGTAITEGIYIFDDISGDNGTGKYAGKSKNVPNRLKQHAGKKIDDVSHVLLSFAVGDSSKLKMKDSLRVAEQFIINTLEDAYGSKGNGVTNKINSISPTASKNKFLNKLVKEVDWCK